MSRSIQLGVLAVALVLAAPVAAATTIDFEAQGSGAPASFPAVNPSGPLTISGATFTGGTLLKNETNSVDLTAVYATANAFGGAGYVNPLTITFASPITSFSLDLTNENAGSYIVQSNTGIGSNQSVGMNSTTNFSISGAGITSVTVLSNSTAPFDFAIDNVTFDGPVANVPEPSTWATMLIGFGMIGGALRWGRRAGLARA